MLIMSNKYEKKSFILFIFTLFLSSYMILNSVFSQPDMLSWVSLFVSTIIFLFSYLIFSAKKIFLFITYIYQYLFIFSCFVKKSYLYMNNISYDIYSYIFLPIMIFFIIIPSIFILRPKLNEIIESKYTNRMILMLFPLILMSIIYLTPYTFNTFLYGAANVRTGGAENSEYWSNMPQNIFTTLNVGIAMLYSIYLFLLFYVISTKNKTIYLFICFLGILSGVIGGLVFATRDRFIYIVLYCCLFYWLWQPYLINNFYFKKIRKYLWFLGFVMLGFFIWITLDRFSSDFYSLFKDSLFYLGAQPYIFAEIVANHENFYGWSYNFPVLFDSDTYMRRDIPYFWMWGTLFQNFYIMGGWFYCLILVFYHFLISSAFFIYFRKLTWLYVVYLILYFQIIVQGVFYFNLGFKGGNLYILLMLLIGLVMQITLLKNNRG